jgi:hypothetical protein
MEILTALPDHSLAKGKIELTKASAYYFKKFDFRMAEDSTKA